MKYFVRIGEREREVELSEHQGELRVRLDGEPLEIDYREVDRLGQVALLVGERSYAVSLDDEGSFCAVTVAGHFFHVAIEDERERAAHAAEREAGAGGGAVDSVMPGVVVELLVGEGDEVERGAPLLILEAMKMQNEIIAPCAGRVTRLAVAAGDAVASGQRLAMIEPPA